MVTPKGSSEKAKKETVKSSSEQIFRLYKSLPNPEDGSFDPGSETKKVSRKVSKTNIIHIHNTTKQTTQHDKGVDRVYVSICHHYHLGTRSDVLIVECVDPPNQH